MFATKDIPLREDVNTLGALLGDVLREQGGEAFFSRVEAVRLAARRRRTGDAGDMEIRHLFDDFNPREAMELVRAFSSYFGLTNLAERVHRIRRRRDYLRDEHTPQPGGLVDVLSAMKQRGVSAEQVQQILAEIRITPVFTAHPTEATRRSILSKEQRLARALVDRISHNLLPGEETVALERIRQEVTLAWETDEFALQPSVAEEVEHVVFYLTDVVYRIVPVFYEGLAGVMRDVYGVVPRIKDPIVRFGSWVGGDMDGNPKVGPRTIRATLTRHRALIIKRYREELRALFENLSQSRNRVGVDGAVIRRIETYRRLFPDEEIAPRYEDMPYRVLVWLMIRRVLEAEADKIHGYQSPQELVDDLDLIAESLLHNKGEHAGHFRVQRLIWRVKTFGFHLATLDIRQDSLVHRAAVGALLGAPDFPERAVGERTTLLEHALNHEVLTPQALDADADAGQTLEVMQTLAFCRQCFGEEAIGPYIISMAQGPDDALAVLYLARRANFVTRGGSVPLDIAPLFETVPDLECAASSVQALLNNKIYREHLRARGDTQIVMLGYSDSNKESGLASSRWALQRAQVELVHVAREAGIKLTLFHGRGGTASRGGSKPRSAVLAEPPGAICGRLRLTEQGEIIDAKYGLRDIALRTLELMGGAVLEVAAKDSGGSLPEAWTEVMEFIARTSRSHFRDLVYDDPDFYSYFCDATPIDVIGRLRIGSRPASRRTQRGIEDLRAIPWVFAWTQNRQMIPGWYGVGTGLKRALDEFGTEILQAMARDWPFFANLLADTEMVLAKADMPIGAMYAELAGAVGKRIWPQIVEEFERTCALVCKCMNTEALLEREPVLKRAIGLRNPYVDPMSFLQVDFLRRWREGNRQDPEIERVLLTTVKGIARGLQNTG